MGDVVVLPPAIEPTQWFIVFHVTSATKWLGLVTPGKYKHVSAFGYLPGVKLWLLYDVQLNGTRIRLLDKDAIMLWTRDCDIFLVNSTGARMGLSSRWFFTCVSAIKHLIGLKCVAITPSGLYRHVSKHGGTLISGKERSAAPAGRSLAATGAAAGSD